jgi:hypothetical protein
MEANLTFDKDMFHEPFLSVNASASFNHKAKMNDDSFFNFVQTKLSLIFAS